MKEGTRILSIHPVSTDFSLSTVDPTGAGLRETIIIYLERNLEQFAEERITQKDREIEADKNTGRQPGRQTDMQRRRQTDRNCERVTQSER